MTKVIFTQKYKKYSYNCIIWDVEKSNKMAEKSH